MPAAFFLKEYPAANRARDSDAGWAFTPFAFFNLSASSGIVMSGSASTHAVSKPVYAANLPLPRGRPWRAGKVEPVWRARCSSFTAKLALTLKCLDAARQDAPPPTCS